MKTYTKKQRLEFAEKTFIDPKVKRNIIKSIDSPPTIFVLTMQMRKAGI